MTSPSSSCEKVDVEVEVDVEGNEDESEEAGSSQGINSSPLDALFALTRKPFEDPKTAGKKELLFQTKNNTKENRARSFYHTMTRQSVIALSYYLFNLINLSGSQSFLSFFSCRRRKEKSRGKSDEQEMV